MPVEPVRSEFHVRLKTPLSQIVYLENFINQHNIRDILTVDINSYMVPKTSHELVVFIVNTTSLISLQDLDSKILQLSKQAIRYYYIAVNKFLIYSEVDNPTDINVDFDEKLLFHWKNLLDKPVIFSQSRSDDHGLIGNFIHPVTFIAWKMHEQD